MNVLITGGAGYMGRAIFRRQTDRAHWRPGFDGLEDWNITAMSRDESKLVRVATTYPRAKVLKGDVTDDVDYLARLFYGYDVVIHMAANKLVDIGERSAFEVMRNNVVGSEHVALAAMKAGVGRVIGISSDKAVQPVNTYGASKFMMERLFQEADRLSPTAFVCARYGNIVGSTISIVTYFREQLVKEGHIKVTDPAMTRFYMGADEGIDAILYALNYAHRGNVVIPKMQAMKTGALAQVVLDIEGFCGDDPRCRIVGHRPGEKLHESLLHLQESVRIRGRVEDQTYFELMPPTEPGSCEPFQITSDAPPLGWMSGEHMLALIADADGL